MNGSIDNFNASTKWGLGTLPEIIFAGRRFFTLKSNRSIDQKFWIERTGCDT
jgi:hypothetical protein